MITLADLPDDIFLRVAWHLDVKDILVLRETCRTLCRATRLKHLWHQPLCAQSDLSPQLASVPYCKPLIELSSPQLEALARHIFALRDRISLGKPPMCSVNLDGTRPVTWVHILQGRWLLVAASDSSASELSLWSLESLLTPRAPHGKSTPAAHAFLRGPVASGIVDIQDEQVTIALELRSPHSVTEIVSIAMKERSPSFVRLVSLPGVSRIRCLSGYQLGFALWNELSIPCIIDWKSNEVTRFYERPDVTGGCIAMDCRGDLVVLMTAERLEVYRRVQGELPYDRSYHLLSSFPLPYPAFDAALAFIDTDDNSPFSSGHAQRRLCTLRLLHAGPGESGLNVYDIEVSMQGQAYWHMVLSHPVDDTMDRYRPAFGKQVQALSWLTGPARPTWSHVELHTTTIPTHPAQPPQSKHTPVFIYAVSDPNMPALSFMGVRDYDETIGILVVGNACGELSVFNLTGSYSEGLQSCFKDAPLPAATGSEWMPTHPVPALAAPPYPYSALGTGERPFPAPEIRDRCLFQWKAERPNDVPNGWTNEFYDVKHNSAPWWFFVPAVGANLAWELERSAHYLGTITPLLYHDSTLTTIFKSGGLLFLFEEEEKSIHVLDRDLSASDAARAFNEGRLSDHIVHTVCSNRTILCTESYRYLVMWEWEKYKYGRNRWRELKERGGEVNADWLIDKRTVELYEVDMDAAYLQQELHKQARESLEAAAA